MRIEECVEDASAVSRQESLECFILFQEIPGDADRFDFYPKSTYRNKDEFGIEVGEIYEFGEDLSPELKDKLEEIYSIVLRAVKKLLR